LKGFEEETEMADCKYFDGCSAPLRPKDEGAVDRTWFPDEDICHMADVPAWVKRQRKVSRKPAQDGYFTLAMLKHDCRVSKGMKGIDPDGTDRELATNEAAWFKAHPVITAEMREKLRAGGEKKRELLHRTRLKKMRSNIGPDALHGEKGTWIPPVPEKA
jgi:hypothetical protein